jgi:transketolase
MRKAFSDSLTQIALSNKRVVLITADLGFQVFDDFQVHFGPRYINVGVSEAQMIYTAAGMAMEGWRPLAYSIASFATARPFEQIRYCVCYPRLPVIIVGAGRGYLYSKSGVSHHASDDLGLMSLLPEMIVVAPGDPNEVAQLLPQLFEHSGPSYFSVGRFGEPTYPAAEPAVLGKARLLCEGERVAIVSTGDLANEVIKAVELLKSEKIYPFAYQMHTVKPLDIATLDMLAMKVETMIVAEEHVPVGGLWGAISSWYATDSKTLRLIRVGAPDAFALGNLRQDELRRRFGLDAVRIAHLCTLAWGGRLKQKNSTGLSSRCDFDPSMRGEAAY